MSTSNLKPSKRQLESNLDQYRMHAGMHLSDLEFEVIQTICKAADKAMRLAARTALAQVPEHLRYNLVPALTAGGSPLPIATQIGDREAYRISIPISFVGKLLSFTPTRGSRPPKNASDYFVSSPIVSVLAAYGHEMSHVFAGHLETSSSLGQETHADYIGGGLLWAWLQDSDIAALCQVPEGEHSAMCAYGFLHLISVLSDSDHEKSLYLPRGLRLGVFAGGAGFYADKLAGRQAGDMVGHAISALPTCPNTDFDSSSIRDQYALLMAQIEEPQMSAKLLQAFQEMRQEQSAWYDSSEHLRPIKKDLLRVLKRDTSSSGET